MSREIKFRVFLVTSEYDENHVDYEKSRMLSWGDLKDHTDPLQEYFDQTILGCSAPMQYTGLKDKNGVSIYEGDIVLSNNMFMHEIPLVVAFENGCYVGLRQGEHEAKGINNLTDQPCEIIGNIYENPELLNPTPQGKEM